jgi:sigma-B regulation protein RsbU (phosphoserine phosphatase)
MADAAMARVLVGDDQVDVQTALRLLLRSEGVHVDAAGSVGEIRARLKGHQYDLLLMDLNYARDTTSGREGLELLAELHITDPLLPVVVMTGWGTIDTAVEAMRHGARGFVNKPWDNAALAAAIRREIEDGRERRRVEHGAAREQEEAKNIQHSLLPHDLDTVNDCTMAAQWVPAKEFGGDYYDALRVDDHRIAFWIGDVCGKGLPAALMMANLQASTRAFAAMGWSPDAVASRVNADLSRHSGLHSFATFFYALYDTNAHWVTFTNAGHNPPIVMHTDGSLERLTSGGMMLGARADTTYDLATIDVVAGDRIILFTDGITEAWSPENEEFGEQRLLDVVRSNRPRGDQEMVAAVFDEIARFTIGRPQDDATVFVIGIA